MKTNKVFITIALAAFMGGSLVSSCANDNDEFLNRNDKELSDLRKEDAAIRAELKRQVETTRADINKKINTLEATLNQLIDEGGQSIYDKLATKMTQTKKLINEKFDGFDKAVDAKLPILMNKLEQSSQKLNNILAKKKEDLAAAIAAKDEENAALIQTEINKIGALQTKMAAAKTRAETFKTQIETLEHNNAAMVEIEQNMTRLQEKYKGQAAEFEKVNGKIRQLVNETFDKLTSHQLNIYQRQLERAKALTEEMETKLEDFKQLSDKLDEIKDKYDSALSDSEPSELITKVEDLESRSSEIESLMSEFESAPNASDFDIDEISAPLDDMIEMGEDELLLLVTANPDDFEELKSYRETAAQDTADLLVKLNDLIAEYESIRDEMFD